jgi:hypothetical protein
MFDVWMLPADHGDCLWIEYGDDKKKYRVLIDGGTPHSFKTWSRRIKDFPGKTLRFELFVITHVDADHIGGALELLRNLGRLGKKIEFGDVWFNGWRHLQDIMGDMQGELVTNHLVRRRLGWNLAFERRAIVVPQGGELPAHVLPGGLRLTLLSPTHAQLDKLKLRWEKTITGAEKVLGRVKDKEKYFEPPSDLLGDEPPDVDDLADRRFNPDRTVANGSSIALLAEYQDGETEKRCLFAADAHVGVLVHSLKRLMQDRRRVRDGRLVVDALKMSHHGSRNNISKGLLDLLDCPRFLFSTNGQQFSHPSPEGVARVIKYGRVSGGPNPQLFFNYQSAFNKIWNNPVLFEKYEYEAKYPPVGEDGLLISL